MSSYGPHLERPRRKITITVGEKKHTTITVARDAVTAVENLHIKGQLSGYAAWTTTDKYNPKKGHVSPNEFWALVNKLKGK